MPRGDRTGPNGFGPMTGRSAGYCTGNTVPGFENGGYRRGMRRGPGWGRGMARGFGGWRGATPYPSFASPPPYGYPSYGGTPFGVAPRKPTRDEELEALRAEADGYTNVLDEIHSRISELESENE